MTGSSGASAAYAPFLARRGRRMALAMAVASVVVFALPLFVLPGPGQGWTVLSGGPFVAFGLLVAALLWRYATLSALPSPEGLVVRNLVLTRRLEWAEVVAVRFAGGDPWVTLDLSDGDTLAVMAIQKADGQRARAEAGRLAALVAASSRTPRDD